MSVGNNPKPLSPSVCLQVDLDVTASNDAKMIGMYEMDLEALWSNPRREDLVSRDVRLVPQEGDRHLYPTNCAGTARVTVLAKRALLQLQMAMKGQGPQKF